MSLNWSQLFARAERIRDEVLREAWTAERPLLLQPSTRPGSLLLLAVGFLWPFGVVLDEKGLLKDEIPEDLMPLSEGIEADPLAPAFWSRFEEWQLTLCTSGSTGGTEAHSENGCWTARRSAGSFGNLWMA
jgi:hypothetical protein